jgi:hypothetical protein
MATVECVTDALDLLVRSAPGFQGIEDFEKTVQAWAAILEPVPDDLLRQAAVLTAREGWEYKSFPKAGDLYQAAMDLADTEPPAEEAWLAVKRHSQNVNAIVNPVKLEGRAAEALRLMGGDRGWMEDEYPFLERKFKEIYAGLRKRERQQQALALPSGGGKGLLPG